MSALAESLAELLHAPAVREALLELIREAMAEHAPAAVAPEVVDIAGMCSRLGVSRPTCMRLVDEGMPTIRVGDHRRVIVADALAWLRARAEREATAGLCTVCSTPHEDSSPGECRLASERAGR